MSDKQTPELEVIVTVSESDRGQVRQVADELKARGLTVTHMMDQSGLIAGTAYGDKLDGLRSLKGVAAVETSGVVQIAPPHSPVQ